MKKSSLLFVMQLLLWAAASGQAKYPQQAPPAARFNNSLGIGIAIPVGSFNLSHTPGAAADYYRSSRRFGLDTGRYRSISFFLHGTLAFHKGRSKYEAGYPFHYGSYWLLSAMAGIDYKPASPVNLSLTAGPVAILYNRIADAGVAVAADWRYHVTPAIAIGPGMNYWKFSRVNALWTASFKGSYDF